MNGHVKNDRQNLGFESKGKFEFLLAQLFCRLIQKSPSDSNNVVELQPHQQTLNEIFF